MDQFTLTILKMGKQNYNDSYMTPEFKAYYEMFEKDRQKRLLMLFYPIEIYSLKIFLGHTPIKEYLSGLPDVVEMCYGLLKAKPWIFYSIFWKTQNQAEINITEEEWKRMTIHPFQFKGRRGYGPQN